MNLLHDTIQVPLGDQNFQDQNSGDKTGVVVDKGNSLVNFCTIKVCYVSWALPESL